MTSNFDYFMECFRKAKIHHHAELDWRGENLVHAKIFTDGMLFHFGVNGQLTRIEPTKA